MCLHMHIHIHTWTHTYLHIYMSVYTHSCYIHMHIHTPMGIYMIYSNVIVSKWSHSLEMLSERFIGAFFSSPKKHPLSSPQLDSFTFWSHDAWRGIVCSKRFSAVCDVTHFFNVRTQVFYVNVSSIQHLDMNFIKHLKMPHWSYTEN